MRSTSTGPTTAWCAGGATPRTRRPRPRFPSASRSPRPELRPRAGAAHRVAADREHRGQPGELLADDVPPGLVPAGIPADPLRLRRGTVERLQLGARHHLVAEPVLEEEARGRSPEARERV